MSYHHRRERKPWGPNATAERIATAAVLVIVVAVLLVFLLVYHDLPFRVS